MFIDYQLLKNKTDCLKFKSCMLKSQLIAWIQTRGQRETNSTMKNASRVNQYSKNFGIEILRKMTNLDFESEKSSD